jgi:hypothetical protein
MRKIDKLKNYEQANLMLEQSYLKSKGLLTEKRLLDYFKTKDDIIKGFFKSLKTDKKKALNLIIPYYDEFTEEGPWDKTPELLPNFYRLFPKKHFQPKTHEQGFVPGTPRDYESKDPYIPTPEDWKKDRTGTNSDSFINDKALGLADKITEKEIQNLLYNVEDFSVKKLGKDILNTILIPSGIQIEDDTPKSSLDKGKNYDYDNPLTFGGDKYQFNKIENN